MRHLPTLLLLFLSLHVFSQENDTPQSIDRNELRLNVLSFIAFSGLDAEYEYFLSEESSLGIGVLVGLGNPDDLDLIRNFALTPYYRQYFSRRYARGFFVEGFGMVLSREDTFFNFDSTETQTETNVALGISVGGKFLTRGGFVAEIFAGVGRTLIDNDDFFFENVIARGGISLGYRF